MHNAATKFYLALHAGSEMVAWKLSVMHNAAARFCLALRAGLEAWLGD